MPPATMTDTEKAAKYAHALELNRLRQKKYYDANKEKLSEARKDLRATLKNDNKDEDDVTELTSNKEVLKKVKAVAGKKESTNLKHHDDLKTFLRLADCNSLSHCLKNPKEIIALIDNSTQKYSDKEYSINSKKGFIQAVLAAITNLKIKLPVATTKMYKAYFDKLKIMSGDQRKAKTTKVIDTFDTYLKTVKTMYGEGSKEYVLSRLYEEATLRDDFHLQIVKSMAEVKKDTTQNYIIVPPRVGRIKLFIQAYKTDATYGDIDIQLSADLTKLIKTYIKTKKIPYGAFLFGTPIHFTDFVSKLNKSLKLKTDGAINNFRHMKSLIILEEEYDIDQRVELARKMTHSPFIQSTYLRNLTI